MSSESAAELGPSAESLEEIEVLVLDCQATAATLERGFVLEIGWSRARAGDDAPSEVTCRRVAPPEGGRVPAAVTRITGLTEHDLADGTPVGRVWDEVLSIVGDVARAGTWRAVLAGGGSARPRPCPQAPAVVHYARFEERLFRALHAERTFSISGAGAPSEWRLLHPGDGLPLDLVCTHEIARRLFPALPRRGLRALAGYFGRSVGPLRRAHEHVEATVFVWRALVAALREHGVATWPALRAWLARSAPARAKRRVYPMPRGVRLALPDRPGVYRLLRISGEVLYVGKATSLRKRVNQHFTKQAHQKERTLEMLAQARDVSFAATETAIEAALLETDEIKQHRPPYNVALLADDRAVWFAAADLASVVDRPDAEHFLGPFGSADLPASFGVLAAALATTESAPWSVADRARLVRVPERFAPDEAAVREGLAAFLGSHEEVLARRRSGVARLRAIGARAWARELARAGSDVDLETADATADVSPAPAARWDAGSVREALDDLVLRASQALRRARWLVALSNASVAWTEPALDDSRRRRWLVIADGEIVARDFLGAHAPVPEPAARPSAYEVRLARVDVARLDRLRVLTTELRRALATTDGSGAEIRFGPRRVLRGEGLRRALRWV
ncbi:MAG: GIY-YIG nuclease family protein [Deltaproteobacteria bacterium]|nr:GIY-YIG nuclease family protein [Deltaproteobacteria bacterium]